MNSKTKKVKSPASNRIKYGLLALFVVAVSFGAFRFYSHYRNKGIADNPSGPTAEQIQQASELDADNKQDFIENNTDDGEVVSTPSQPADSSIELSARKEADSTVTVTTKLPGVAAGTCTLEITNGTKSASKSAPVIYQPEFSTCAGFSIPVSEVGSGTWAITLKLAGTDISKSISLEVN
jgi:hypothetical protein